MTYSDKSHMSKKYTGNMKGKPTGLEEALERQMYVYDYPMPSIVVDIVVMADSGTKFLLVERKNDPWKGLLALPGGFVEYDEEIADAARRELAEETGLINVNTPQFVGYYDWPERDPRGRVVSMAFLVDYGDNTPDVTGMDDVCNAQWHETEMIYMMDTAKIAADHCQIIKDAILIYNRRKK